MRRHTPRALALLLLLLRVPALCASNDAAAEHRRLDETHVSRGCSGGTLCGPYTLCSAHSDCPIGRYCNNGHDRHFDGANYCVSCMGLTPGWCDPYTCPIDSDTGIGGSLQNTCAECCLDDALLVQCPLEEWNLLNDRCENRLAVWAGAALSTGGMSGLFFLQLVIMVVPLGIFITRKKRGVFDPEQWPERWPEEICCCTSAEYLETILKSHLFVVVLGGLLPFCGIPCLPVVWLWSFVYYPGYLTRDRRKIYVYMFFQAIGVYYWWKVLGTHMINAFLFSFGSTHGYIGISAGPPEGLSKYASMLAGANMLNCFLGFFGALNVVTAKASPQQQTGPVVVVQAVAVEDEEKGED